MSDNKSLVLKQSHAALEKLLTDKSRALPKDFNKTRFLQNAITVLQDTRDIEKCNPASVARTMLKGAFLGLDFFNRECYAIIYGNQVQFQTDYKGEKKLAKKYSINPIQDIYAKVVREGDEFEEKIEDGKRTINFKPQPFSSKDIIGAFAVVMYEDGSMDYETMSVNDIEEIRTKFSKAQNSKAWKDSYGEMCKKTVLRRLCKNIEKDFESIEQQKTYDDSADCEFANNKETAAVNDVSAYEDIAYTVHEEGEPNGTEQE